MRVDRIVPEFVASFPSDLEPGVLYVSTMFSTTAHACACGCGREVIAPLSPAQWVLTFDGTVSLRPSIGNWGLPCGSHYLIDRGRIRWAGRFTSSEVRRNREADGRALDAARPSTTRSWWRRLGDVLRRRRSAVRD
ncbi:hypothetical protein B7W94_01850 [Microbacterium sp. LEMMJ01]|nr:hypothetical protein B7W94_01850 [Microbacterium sp. LEMMJ01]